MKKATKDVYSKTEARYNLPTIINRVRDGEGPVYITDRGVITAVVISNNEFERNIKKSKKEFKFSDLKICGMWKDREDMKDSVKWVQNLRSGMSDRNKYYWERPIDDK